MCKLRGLSAFSGELDSLLRCVDGAGEAGASNVNKLFNCNQELSLSGYVFYGGMASAEMLVDICALRFDRCHKLFPTYLGLLQRNLESRLIHIQYSHSACGSAIMI